MKRLVGILLFSCAATLVLPAQTHVSLLEVPGYLLYVGCFGTASGNLMGFWDRHGFPDFYTGPTGGGVAPLDDSNPGIRSLWASKAGVDGRPADQPGHVDDYYVANGSTQPDPYITAGREEHAPDCIGDFIGLNQRKWTNMNNECNGNVDYYVFVYWETNGTRRVNFTPSDDAGLPPRDLQSGLREWTRYRGYEADVFTQLTDFNPHTPPGTGFTFEDLKAEINAGYPVLLFLQPNNQFYRTPGAPGNMEKVNPLITGMVAYGYEEWPDYGIQYVYVRPYWGGYDNYSWSSDPWLYEAGVGLSLRGVIGYHPHPRIRSIERVGEEVVLSWDGPSALLYDEVSGTTNAVHRYQVEQSSTLSPATWEPASPVTTERIASVSGSYPSNTFFRVRLLGPGENP